LRLGGFDLRAEELAPPQVSHVALPRKRFILSGYLAACSEHFLIPLLDRAEIIRQLRIRCLQAGDFEPQKAIRILETRILRRERRAIALNLRDLDLKPFARGGQSVGSARESARGLCAPAGHRANVTPQNL
jgi:hypothetical protein